MRSKARTRAGRLFALIVTICMVCMMALPVMAEGEDEAAALTVTDDPRESIMMITLGYQDDNGVYMAYGAGTCFLINDEYVLTNKHVVSLSTYEDIDGDGKIDFEAFRDWAKANFTNVPDNLLATDSHIKIKVYVNRDMKVDGTMHASVNSDDMDFAAVKLAEKIYDRKPIALGDSDALEAKATVYAYGFPEDSINVIEYNTKEDVSVTSGTVSKVSVITDQRGVSAKNIDAIEHSAVLNHGNSGGPLLDENNAVMGVNSYGKETKNYSIQINVIKKALDTFGIPYLTAGESGETEEPDVETLKADLESAVSAARAVKLDGYTEESVAAFQTALSAAEAVLEKGEELTAEEITQAQADLESAQNGLALEASDEPVEAEEPKQGTNWLLIGGIIAAVIIVIIIILVVVMSSGKKKKTAKTMPPSGAAPGAVPGAGPMPGADSMPGTTPGQMPSAMQDGAGETTLLNAGAGETTLLGGGGSSAYLIRKKNGEKIMINLQNFKIGKERRRVNYCVADNTTVSRLHCEIIRKGADYYVVDQNSANYTYVNGVQISPNKETLLSDQSVLKLSDEEFEFHLS